MQLKVTFLLFLCLIEGKSVKYHHIWNVFFVLGLQYSGKIMMLLMAQAPHISESSLKKFDNASKLQYKPQLNETYVQTNARKLIFSFWAC